MRKNLVSVITPCYNSAKFVHRLLDSILMQTHLDVEMFTIDDGSTDDTSRVIQSYIPRFKQRGYSLTYIFQENSGQSEAINKGLKLINGEYFIWPDSDDYYTDPDAFATMVQALSQSDSSVGTVRCGFSYVDESSLTPRYTHCFSKQEAATRQLFNDCLLQLNNFHYACLSFMHRTSALFDTIPDKTIYTQKKAGQNSQLMLPVFYHYKCVTLDGVFCNITERASSHSRKMTKGLNELLAKEGIYKDTILETLKRIPNIPDDTRKKLGQAVRLKYATITYRACIHSKKLKSWAELYRNRNYVGISWYLDFITPFTRYTLFNVIISFCEHIRILPLRAKNLISKITKINKND